MVNTPPLTSGKCLVYLLHNKNFVDSLSIEKMEAVI